MTQILRSIPLLLLPALLYAAVTLTMGQNEVPSGLAQNFVSFYLPSGAMFEITRGAGIVLFAGLMLFVEIVKSTSTSKWALFENGLAFLLFSGALVFFLLNPAFGTIEFALIMLFTAIDFVAGFVVMTVSARRDVSFADGHA